MHKNQQLLERRSKCITEVVSIAISFLVYTNIFGLLHKEKVEFMIYTLQPS